MAYKMKGSPMARNFGAPFKKDTVPSVQDNTRTPRAKKITIKKFDAENAWKLGDKDKFDNLMTRQEHKYQYNNTVKRIDDANKKLTTKFTDKEKQKIIDKDLRKREDKLIRKPHNQ